VAKCLGEAAHLGSTGLIHARAFGIAGTFDAATGPMARHQRRHSRHQINGRSSTPGPIWVLLPEQDRALGSLLAEVLRCDGHRIIEVSDGVALLLNLVALGFDPVSPGVAAVVVCGERMSTVVDTSKQIG
jgi:hypothetical protein